MGVSSCPFVRVSFCLTVAYDHAHETGFFMTRDEGGPRLRSGIRTFARGRNSSVSPFPRKPALFSISLPVQALTPFLIMSLTMRRIPRRRPENIPLSLGTQPSSIAASLMSRPICILCRHLRSALL